MAQIPQKDILYLDKVGGGNPLKGEASVGFFAITDKHLIYTPSHSQKITTENALSDRQTLHTNDVYTYDELPFWKVVPTKANELSSTELSKYIFKMAEELDNSKVVRRSDVQLIKVGVLRVSIEAGEESFTVNLGLGGKKKRLKEFLAANPIGTLAQPTSAADSFKPGAGTPGGSKKKVAIALCAGLLAVGGYFSASDSAAKKPMAEGPAAVAKEHLQSAKSLMIEAKEKEARYKELMKKSREAKRDGYCQILNSKGPP